MRNKFLTAMILGAAVWATSAHSQALPADPTVIRGTISLLTTDAATAVALKQPRISLNTLFSTMTSADIVAALGYTPGVGSGGGAGVASVAGRTGVVTLIHSDLTDWSSATSGFLASAVTSVAAGTGLTGGTITTTGTLAVSYGTTAGTAAQGNDSRIMGALQAANSLSDVGNAATARSNIGAAPAASPTLTNAALANSLTITAGTQTGNATLTATSPAYQLVTLSSAGATITLPTSPGSNLVFSIHNSSTSGAYGVQVQTSGAVAVGSALAAGSTLTVIWTGSVWEVL